MPYLKLLGIKSGLTIEDRLNSLAALAEKWNGRGASRSEIRAKEEEAWKELASRAVEIGSGLKENFSRRPIFLVGDRWGTPDDTIIVPDSASGFPPQALGRTTFVADSWPAAEALTLLGAHPVKELDGRVARRLLDQADDGPLSGEQAEMYLIVAAFGASRGWWTGSKPIRLPISERRSLSLALPSGKYLGNAAEVSIFQNVPILTASPSNGLERLCLEWGAKNIDTEVRYTCPLEEGSLELEGVLSRSWRHLVSYLPEQSDSIEWKRSVEVVTTTRQFGEYEVGSYRGRFPLPSLIPSPMGHPRCLTTKGQETFSKEDLEMFAEWAVATGFPADKRDIISNTILLIQQAPEQVEEPEDVAEREEYISTVETLHRMYGGCQVCTQVTP